MLTAAAFAVGSHFGDVGNLPLWALLLLLAAVGVEGEVTGALLRADAIVAALAGSRVWRALGWTVVGILAGQLAIAIDLVPTYVRAPYVHGLAALGILGMAFVIPPARHENRGAQAGRRWEQTYLSVCSWSMSSASS